MSPLMRSRNGIRNMKYFRLKIAVAAVTCLTISAAAGHAESPAIRNCTWCHGGSAQGYTPAPRLAGQRPQYIEKQLMNFSAHTRDNPFSKLYMGRRSESQSARRAQFGRLFFDDTAESRQRRRQGARRDRKSDLSRGNSGCQRCGLRRLPWPECPGRWRNSPTGRASLHLLAKKAGTVGRGIPCGCRPADAAHCQQIVAETHCSPRVLPQFYQVSGNPVLGERIASEICARAPSLRQV